MQRQAHIRAVIFDLGGVLLRTEDHQPREALAKQLGLPRAKLEDVVFQNPVAQQAEQGKASVAQVWKEAARELGQPESFIPTLSKQFFAGDRVDFELIDLIQRLRPAYTTALLSNTWIVDLPRWIREELEIPETFDMIISSAQLGLAKPDPAIFQQALKLVQAAADETVFVDDNERNIAAAQELHMHTIHFRNAAQARSELLGLVQLPDQT